MHKRKPGQPHKGWKKAAAKSRRTTLPIARTEPLCFSHVDGLRSCAGMASGSHGSAKMGVGDGAASCELKAPFVSSGTALEAIEGAIYAALGCTSVKRPSDWPAASAQIARFVLSELDRSGLSIISQVRGDNG